MDIRSSARRVVIRTSVMATVTGKAIFLWCLISLFPVTLTQSVELVCNASVVYVTVTENGGLEFAPFPPDYVVASEVEYDPGALGPWYSFAEGIINVARPGSVTEGKKKARQTEGR